MLDERDLQAIAQLMVQQRQGIMEDVEKLMDTKLAQQKSELQAEIRTSESHMMAMMEAYFEPKFNLLADGIQLIREQMVTKEDLEERQEDIQTQLDVLKAVVRRNSVEIEKLKKAQ